MMSKNNSIGAETLAEYFNWNTTYQPHLSGTDNFIEFANVTIINDNNVVFFELSVLTACTLNKKSNIVVA